MKKNKGFKNSFVFFLLYSLLFSSSILSAQNQKEVYNIKLNNVTFKEAMVKITSISGYFFVYEDADVANIPKINREYVSSTVEQIMEGCLKGTDLTFSIDKKVIYIKRSGVKAPAKTDGNRSALQQDSLYVSGKITDANNFPLTGASVVVKGDKNKGVVADYDGNYKLRITDPGKQNILVFNFLGMQPQEV